MFRQATGNIILPCAAQSRSILTRGVVVVLVLVAVAVAVVVVVVVVGGGVVVVAVVVAVTVAVVGVVVVGGGGGGVAVAAAVAVLVWLLFYGPSTHFRSFRARSVNLATLFLGKPPRQFTST